MPAPARRSRHLRSTLPADPRTGLAPIHVAVHEASEEALETLLEMGADVDLPTLFDRDTPAVIAAREGHVETLEWLVREWHANLYRLNAAGHSTLHAAAVAGQAGAVRCLVEHLSVDPDIR